MAEEGRIRPAIIIGAAAAGVGIAAILTIYALARATKPIPPGECIIWGFVTDSLTGGGNSRCQNHPGWACALYRMGWSV
jgi:hypothetical protein